MQIDIKNNINYINIIIIIIVQMFNIPYKK